MTNVKPAHWAELVPTPKWVRVFFGGEVVADSKDVMLLREAGETPVYYFPRPDVRTELLNETDRRGEPDAKGTPKFYSLQVGEAVAKNAAWRYVDLAADAPRLENYIAFQWGKMEAWYEEDEQVFVHPRDPHVRLDLVHSSRSVRVVIAGETVAETRRPVLLFETGLPERYYIPKVDVHMELLVLGDLRTRCPYKGEASHYSVQVEEERIRNIAWAYPFPNPEVAKIQNMICFYNERLDQFYVDGERLPQPETPWS